MFCPNCGTSNDEGALFCANCGTRLEFEPVVTEGSAASDDNAVPQQPEVQTAQVNVQPQVTLMYEQPQNGTMGNSAKKPFKLSKKIVIIGAVVVAVIAAVIVFICVGNSLTNYKKTAGSYVKAVEECDWAKAYSLVQIPDSEFLSLIHI